jgi:phosphatidylinositol alpha-1,6-mannosyltransferase
VRRTLVVTNDFPPRAGGIQSFVHALVSRLPPDAVTVYAPRWDGAATFDAAQRFSVVRHPTPLMLPVPSVRARAASLVRERRCTAVWFGAAAPLALLAPALRRAGVERVVASTHGHEAGWAQLPGGRQALRRIGDGVDALTYLGDYTRGRIGAALSPAAVGRLHRLPPGVDVTVFRPDADGDSVRRRHGLGNRPVVLCVSRLVPRKGQDVLVRALPRIRAQAPDAVLLLVGGGPDQRRIAALAQSVGVSSAVVCVGPVPWPELPSYYAAGDVFAMPCRTRRRGLDVEGLGIVYLEASATGLPVVAGESGGAPDAVLDGRTGYVVDGRDERAVADSINALLLDRDRARAMGAYGRAWVTREWRWEVLADQMAELLDGPPPTTPAQE